MLAAFEGTQAWSSGRCAGIVSNLDWCIKCFVEPEEGWSFFQGGLLVARVAC